MTTTPAPTHCTNPTVRTYLVCEALNVREVRLTARDANGAECNDVFQGWGYEHHTARCTAVAS